MQSQYHSLYSMISTGFYCLQTEQGLHQTPLIIDILSSQAATESLWVRARQDAVGIAILKSFQVQNNQRFTIKVQKPAAQEL